MRVRDEPDEMAICLSHRRSPALGDVTGGNPERQALPANSREASCGEAARELRFGWKMRHGSRQVSVCRMMPADHASDQRKDVMEVRVVEEADDSRARRREL